MLSRIDFDDEIGEITLPLRHEDVITQQAERFDIDPALIAAIIKQESNFRDQTSDAGARGLMQITPETADTIETLSGGETFVYEDLADSELNIRYGSYYLNHLLDRFAGNEVAALAGYNGGPENAAAWGGSELEFEDIPSRDARLRGERARVARAVPRQLRGRAGPLSRARLLSWGPCSTLGRDAARSAAAHRGCGARRSPGDWRARCRVALAPVCGLALLVLYGWAAPGSAEAAIVPGYVAVAVLGALAGCADAAHRRLGADRRRAGAPFAVFAAPVVLR